MREEDELKGTSAEGNWKAPQLSKGEELKRKPEEKKTENIDYYWELERERVIKSKQRERRGREGY